MARILDDFKARGIALLFGLLNSIVRYSLRPAEDMLHKTTPPSKASLVCRNSSSGHFYYSICSFPVLFHSLTGNREH